MHVTYRSYLTAGVAVLGAGAVALTPIQPLPSQAALAPQRTIANLQVDLASSIDPITPWVDTIKLSVENAKKLWEFYLEEPFPLIHTIGTNIGTYIKALPDFQFIGQNIAANVVKFFEAPWSPGPCSVDPCGDPAFYEGVFISDVPITNHIPFLGQLSQQQLYGLLPQVLASSDPDLLIKLAPLLAFTANHYSGQVAGLVGPLLAPVIQLTRSFTAIGEYFKQGDVIGAINELINIPANVTNAVLNGAGYFDLTGVVNAIQPLPPEVKSIGLNLGGLISPPVPFKGTVDEPTESNGGTLFDNIAMSAEALGLAVESPGLPVSWFGSVIGLGQYLSKVLLVTPPTTPEEAAPAATTVAPKAAAAVAAPAVEAAPVVAEAPAPVVAEPAAPAEAPAPAVPEPVVPDPVISEDPVVDIAEPAEVPAPRSVSANQKQAGASDNDGGSSTRGGHKGARGSNAA